MSGFVRKKLFNKFILPVLAGSIVFLMLNYSSNPEPKEYIVELREEGFYPNKLEINVGDTVKFSTALGASFWPASNEHPIHSIYSEFDPKKPIPANENWSFTFNKNGTWNYHDHLSPYFNGTIVVKKNWLKSINSKTKVSCVESNDKGKCWRDSLFVTLENKGLNAALEHMAILYKQESDFSANCHTIAHDLGSASYRLYLKDKDSVFSAKAAYCANGFYHGFMHTFMASESIEKAREFCLEVDKKLKFKAPDAFLQCYHGIGHGAIDIATLKKNISDERDIINPALELCEKVSRADNQLYRCASGIFNGLANSYLSGEFGLSPRKDDPFWICHLQPDRFKESCYGNMNSLILGLSKNNFVKAAKFVGMIKEDKYSISAIRYLAGLSTLNLAKKDPAKAVKDCRSLKEILHLPCIEGFAHGFLEHGTPDNEYKDAINFCDTKIMSQEERGVCMKYAIGNIGGWYSLDRVRQIYNGLNNEQKKYFQSI